MLKLTLLALSSLTLAQKCIPDQLLDDLSNPQIATSGPSLGRYINLLGGDYGTDSTHTSTRYTASTASTPGYISVIPTVLQTPLVQNFFFSKRNAEACFDLSGYLGFQFGLEVVDGNAGVGQTYDSSFTLTQKSADCATIVNGGESQYQPISKFTPTGSIHANTLYSIILPFSSFSLRNNPAIGGPLYDFTHFKDFTWNAFTPVNVEYRFFGFKLLGNCTELPLSAIGDGIGSSVSGGTGTGGSGSGSGSKVATSGQKSSTSGSASNSGTVMTLVVLALAVVFIRR